MNLDNAGGRDRRSRGVRGSSFAPESLAKFEWWVDVRDEISLTEWLRILKKPPRGKCVEDFRFPNPAARNEYLAQAGSLDAKEVIWLLERFLAVEGPFGSDERALRDLAEKLKGGPRILEAGERSYVERREIRAAMTGWSLLPRDSIIWIVDLIDQAPQEALQALRAYFLCHWPLLPDGRVEGLLDAMDIIRARYATAVVPDDALDDVSSRDLELLVAALYERMGFEVQVTQPTRDHGRDVIARKSERGSKTTILVNATRAKITRPDLDKMLGVIDWFRANLGVVVGTSRSSADAEALAREHPRIDVINRAHFIELLNANFGQEWPTRLESIITRAKAHHTGRQPSSPTEFSPP